MRMRIGSGQTDENHRCHLESADADRCESSRQGCAQPEQDADTSSLDRSAGEATLTSSPNASGATGTAVWEELAQEVLHRNPRGRILVAIDGVDAAARMHFADALAAALRAVGRHATRLSAAPFTDDDAVRTILRMFRHNGPESELAAAPEDRMLIVDGWSLLRSSMRSAWHFTVFLDGGEPAHPDTHERHLRYMREDIPRESSDAVYEVSDSMHPQRLYFDSC